MGEAKRGTVTCMPWPLAVLCWLDNRGHARRGDGPEGSALACRAHDKMLHFWLKVGSA